MAKFNPGDEVYVPASVLSDPDGAPSALVLRRVQGLEGRSVIVDDGPGMVVKVGSARVHDPRLGVLIVKVGDWVTESTLLDPLAKSVMQFLRLLLPDDNVRMLSVRTLTELRSFWETHHNGYSRVVLVAHASDGLVTFVDEASVTGQALADTFGEHVPDLRKKLFVSLACGSGRQDFAKAFSEGSACSHLLAPFGAVHGAAASHFAQSFLVSLLLDGKNPMYSFKTAAKFVLGGTHFRLWQDGSIKAGKMP